MCHRSPDWSDIYASDNAVLAHERLSIVSVNTGVQPFYNQQKTHVLAINGEIYNHQALHAEYDDHCQFQAGSDCEVILTLYQEKGSKSLDDLQSMFVFTLYDNEKDAYPISRDRLGIIPLYTGYGKHGQLYVTSEMKAPVPVCHTIKEFPMGSCLWSQDGEIRSYHHRDWFDYDTVKDNMTDKNELHQALENSAKSHLMSDVPYGVLLSDGLDSSIISAITKKCTARHVEDQGRSKAWWPQSHSFTIDLPGSPDLKVTREMVNHLGTVYHEIHFAVQEDLDAIRGVIYHIETYDTITIHASTSMYLMLREIEAMGIKVMLSGGGFDEVSGGCLYFYKVLSVRELHEEMACKLLVLHMHDCARADKAMSVWGMEARVPFPDEKFLDVATHINPQDKMCGNDKMEKHVLRECPKAYLPAGVAWQQREQFSDDVGYSWVDTSKEVAAQQVSDQQLKTTRFHLPLNTPTSRKAYLYREIFEESSPLPSAAECVPGGSFAARSSVKAIEQDEAFKKMDDSSGCAVGVHQSVYK